MSRLARIDPQTQTSYVEAPEDKQEFGNAFIVLVNPRLVNVEITVRRDDWLKWEVAFMWTEDTVINSNN